MTEQKEDQPIESRLQHSERPRTLGDRIESWSRIVAAVCIPVVLGYYGSKINQSISQRSLEKDYVTVALEILTKPTERTHPGLRAWAATVFAQYSPVQFDAATLAELASGDVLPPEASAVVGEAQVGQAVLGAVAKTVQLKLVLPGFSPPEVFLDHRRVDFSDGVAEVRVIAQVRTHRQTNRNWTYGRCVGCGEEISLTPEGVTLCPALHIPSGGVAAAARMICELRLRNPSPSCVVSGCSVATKTPALTSWSMSC
jgi:hypothetical protein